MATKFSTYLLYCETGVHAGDGTSSGTIDNPIQKERTTKFCTFRDTTLRGAVRESFGEDLKAVKEETINDYFYPTFGHKENGEKNSALNVFPARILFFPVRSFEGVFGYITCPFVLKRFQNDMNLFKKKIDLGDITNINKKEIIADDELTFTANEKKYVGLEEFLFSVKNDENSLLDVIKKIMPSEHQNFNHLKTHLTIVNDTTFKYFVNLFTEKVTRNKINVKTGTADDRALFNVEYLPEDSILYTAFGFSNEFPKNINDTNDLKTDQKIQNYFDANFVNTFELGGDKSVGKGLVSPFKIF